MYQPVEPVSGVIVLEGQAGQLSAVEFASASQNLRTKSLNKASQQGRVLLDHIAADPVGIDYHRPQLLENLSGCRFARADLTGDTNNHIRQETNNWPFRQVEL